MLAGVESGVKVEAEDWSDRGQDGASGDKMEGAMGDGVHAADPDVIEAAFEHLGEMRLGKGGGVWRRVARGILVEFESGSGCFQDEGRVMPLGLSVKIPADPVGTA